MQEPQDSAQSEIAGKSGEEIIAYIKEKYDKFADETQNSVEALEIKFVLATAGIGIDDPKETVERHKTALPTLRKISFRAPIC